MDHIFQPGRFSLHSIARALNVSYLNKYVCFSLLFKMSENIITLLYHTPSNKCLHWTYGEFNRITLGTDYFPWAVVLTFHPVLKITLKKQIIVFLIFIKCWWIFDSFNAYAKKYFVRRRLAFIWHTKSTFGNFIKIVIKFGNSIVYK